jgi:glycosyltransferase involved in cell wall biosynthesis
MARNGVLIAIQNISYTHDTRMLLVARSLQGAGYRVHVLCPRSADDPKHAVRDGVEIFFFRMPIDRVRLGGLAVEYLYSGATMTALALAVCARRRIGIVHVCLPPPVLVPLARLLRALGRIVVVDQHDLAPELFELRYGRRSRLARLVRRTERWALQRADHVIVTNETGADVARGRCEVEPGRVTVVRTGPDLVAVPLPRRNGAGGSVRVGYVGNLGPQDGIDQLVLAAARIRRVHGRRDIRFLCIGTGSELPRAEALAADLRLESSFEFAGRLPHGEVLERLAECDICVQPDEKNPFNDSCTMIKALEYMALGKPVVAFDLVETRISCGGGALYADGGSDELADLIVTLADDPALRRRLGEEGRRRIEQELAWRYGEQRLLALYARLSGHGSGGDVEWPAVEAVRDGQPGDAKQRRGEIHQV